MHGKKKDFASGMKLKPKMKDPNTPLMARPKKGKKKK